MMAQRRRRGEIRLIDRRSASATSGRSMGYLWTSGGRVFSLLARPVRQDDDPAMIGGFELPTSGRSCSAIATSHGTRRQAPVNMVFTALRPFPHLDVASNIASGCKRRKVDKAEIGRRVGEILGLVRLEGYGGASRNSYRRPAATRRARPGYGESTDRAAPDEPLGALDLSCAASSSSSSSASRPRSGSRSCTSPTTRRRR